MFEINTYGTLVVATLVLLTGRKLVKWLPVLNKYTIPEPIVGGLCAAIILFVLKLTGDIEVHFDTSMKDPMMLAFFATIGLNANLAKLKAGGKALVLFFLVVIIFLFVQNVVGIGVATFLGIDPLLGLIGGSITMSGGHATGAAWADIFTNRYGLENASEMAVACATFGLILGGLLGGPITSYLMKKTPLPANFEEGIPLPFEKPEQERAINSSALIESIALIVLCLSVGQYIELLLKGTFFELPSFVCVLFVGVTVSNLLSALGIYTVFERAMSTLGNVSLSLFLAIALMTLNLWGLASLAIPMLIILIVQAIVMALYAIHVTYRVMGRNYDAVVLTAGHCGFGMGATPTAIANMQAVTNKYGPSHIAFLVVPMVAAFFLDLVNALAIKLFLLLPMFPSPF